MSTHLFGTGFAHKIKDLDFDPGRDYVACLLCGEIYQSELDRANAPFKSNLTEATLRTNAKERRDFWAKGHAQTHPQKEHELLRLSGLSMTPEAANKLAAFGLLPITDMVLNEEVAAALFESHPVPTKEAES